MAERIPLTNLLGNLQELQAGDSLTGVRETVLTGLANLNASPIATDTLLVAIGKLTNNQQSQALTTTTVVLDFSPLVSNVQIIAITAASTFTTANLTTGQHKDIFITSGTASLGLTFPANWIFYGTKPTATVASKELRVRMTSFGTSDTTVRAESVTQS